MGDIAMGGTELLARRTVALLQAIRDSDITIGRGRAKLRVAMPILSIAGGGMGSGQGSVLASLLAALTEAARRLDLDVVLVTPSTSAFSAAQHVRRKLSPWPLNKRLLDRARQVGELAHQGHLALFLGAGVSVPAGLPTWTQLLDTLAVKAGLRPCDLGALPVLDQAQLLSLRMPTTLGHEVATIASRAKRPSLAHALLAGLGCREAITTNYDTLYETAAAATGQPISSVLPWHDTTPSQPWILKMHGDVRRPETIVLTRRHFVRYDAEARPSGSMLQALLLTRHLLFVGASLNDDNVSRLVHEVDQFRRSHGRTSTIGTFLDVDGTPARQELWSDQLRWIALPGATVEERARMMEVFLDAVGAHATADSSWLLDERFSGLLSEDGRSLAGEARALHARAAKLGAPFDPLVAALSHLGADVVAPPKMPW
ncbi:SIR2 family protein [Knoellia sp. CPCC 206435]|uniref:SIR2 family protein n=1 Tax=Knoellia terrae TaxID=3404797 RepID=UPI003B427C9C